MHRFRRSCVRVRESTLLVALSRTGLARGRLLLDRLPPRVTGVSLASGYRVDEIPRLASEDELKAYQGSANLLEEDSSRTGPMRGRTSW